MGEDGADKLGEDVEDGGNGGEAEANGKRKTHDDHVALGEAAACHHAETGEDDASEHHNGAAAKYSLGNGGEDCANGWNKAAENENCGSGGNGEAIDNLSEGGKSYVLRERGEGRAAEQSGYGADETVAGHRGSHLLLLHLTAKGARAYCRRVADGFRGGDEIDTDYGENGIEMKLGGEGKKARQ